MVALHDRGVDNDHLFLVMERVEGTTLAAYLRANGPLTPGRALEIAQEICAALVAAHTAHVIHYDIKPLNIMLTGDGRVKVVDFGIAGFVQTTFAVARSADLPAAGTPEYGAPEQFGTERGDERSDLYALGGVLFTLLTGRPPFTGPNGFAVVQRKLSEAAPSAGSLRPELPPAVVQLVDELLRRDPDQRPQKAVEVHDRISRQRSALDVLDLANAPTIVAEGPDFLRHGVFEITWTSKDRFGGRTPGARATLWVGWIFVGLVVIGGLTTLGAIGPPPNGWADIKKVMFTDSGLSLKLLLWGTVIAIVFTLMATPAVIYRAARVRSSRPWSLRIDADGITTVDAEAATAATGPSGRRTFRWADLRIVTLEEIRRQGGYHHPALHVGFTTGSAGPARGRLAGWVHASHTTTVRKDGRIPLCVLGPLDEQQHADLTQALARHAGQRWHPEID